MAGVWNAQTREMDARRYVSCLILFSGSSGHSSDSSVKKKKKKLLSSFRFPHFFILSSREDGRHERMFFSVGYNRQAPLPPPSCNTHTRNIPSRVRGPYTLVFFFFFSSNKRRELKEESSGVTVEAFTRFPPTLPPPPPLPSLTVAYREIHVYLFIYIWGWTHPCRRFMSREEKTTRSLEGINSIQGSFFLPSSRRKFLATTTIF